MKNNNVSRRALLLGGAATATGLALPTSPAQADIDPIPPILFPAPRPVCGYPGVIPARIFVRWSDYGVRVKVFSSANGGTGEPWVNLGKPNGLNTVGSPGAIYASKQYVFARATDNTVWVAAENSGSWGSWSSLGGSISSRIEAIGIWANAGSTPKPMYLFARDADGGLVYRANPGLGWGPWNILSGAGTITGNPCATSYFPDGADDPQPRVFVRWTPDNSVRFIQRNPNGTWSGWTSLGTTATADPAVTPRGGSLLYQRGYDGRLWYKYELSTGAWSGWNLLILDPGNPAMKVVGSVAFDVASVFQLGFVRDENDAIWSLDGHWYNGHWTQYAPTYLGGVVNGHVGAGHSDSGSSQWALVRGMDDALWARRDNVGGWISLGGSLA